MKAPKIRFKGFEGDWEEKKIDNICNRFDNLRIPISAKNRIPGSIPYYWANGIQDYVDWYTHNWEFLLIAEDWANDLKNYPIQYVKWKIWVNNHAHVLQWKQELSNNIFLKYAIKHTNIESLLVWWWRAKLNASVLMWIDISLPSPPEQEKIWALFEQLDSHISKNQQKLEKLKNMKHSFLQKFFPKDWSALPELRFKGFEGAWEERKLGEIFEEYSEKNHMEFPVLTIMQWIGTMLRSEVGRNLQYNKNNVSNYKLVNKDDFIVHLRSFEWGLEKSNHTWIVSPAYHILHWENINSVFYYVYFRSFNFINQKLISHVYWIRDWKSIDIPWMKTIKIPYTSFKEQEKIGNFIQKIELQITKQQEKLEKLQNLKQSLLEKMFI